MYPFFIHGEETYDAAVDRLKDTWQTQLADFVVQAATNIWGVIIMVHQPGVEPLIILPEEGKTSKVVELQFEQPHAPHGEEGVAARQGEGRLPEGTEKRVAGCGEFEETI